MALRFYRSERKGPRYGHIQYDGVWKWRRVFGSMKIWPEKEPNPHMLIVGMSGYGKSTLCRQLIMEIGKTGRKVLIFDVHNEHAEAVCGAGGKVFNAVNTGINIFALDGLYVRERIAELVSLFTDVFGLGILQTALLEKCLQSIFMKIVAPTISDLINEIGLFERFSKTPTMKNSLRSMRSKLYVLNTEAFKGNSVSFNDVKNSTVSFSLAGIRSKEARTIYINEVLKRLYRLMKDNEKEKGIRHYIMIDEAQVLIGNNQSAGKLIRNLMEEGRKYGVGVIVATHSASQLEKQIVTNAATFVSFYAREPDEVEYVSAILGGGNKQMMDQIKDCMMKMTPHEALVIKGSMDYPVLVRTQSAKWVSKRLAEFKTSTDTANERRMLEILDYARKPCTKGIIEKSLGNTHSILLNELVRERRIQTMIWEDSKGEKEVWYMAPGGITLEHELHILKMSEKLKANGVPNIITRMGRPGFPDIIAYAFGRRYAIEYETGLKEHAQSGVMLKRREQEYEKTYVVVSEKHFERYLRCFRSEKTEILRFKDLEKIIPELGGTLPKEKDQKRFKEGEHSHTDEQDSGDSKVDEGGALDNADSGGAGG